MHTMNLQPLAGEDNRAQSLSHNNIHWNLGLVCQPLNDTEFNGFEIGIVQITTNLQWLCWHYTLLAVIDQIT